MDNYFFKFEKIYEDDHMLEIRLSASNSRVFAQNEFYTCPEVLSEYADKLVDYFPNSESDIIKHEYGVRERGDSDTNSYVQFNIVPYGGKGEILIDIDFIYETWSTHLGDFSCHFFLKTDVAGINNLGKNIKSWLRNTNESMNMERSV